ncbi:hypothetical protein [Nonomuraea rubra]|uniref:hypothetical protein n=1 Tax=Nonomuraea rubra TaxID=46180 RepID=UPI0034052589
MKKAPAAATAAATLLAATTLLGAAPAQAAAPDPVRAVRNAYTPGHGVKFSEVMTMKSKGSKPQHLKITGTYEFGASGIIAYDVTARTTSKSGKPRTMRILWKEHRVYMYTNDFDLPEGKKWVVVDDDDLSLSELTPSSQPADIFQPGQLKSLVSRAGSVRDGVYRGTFGYEQARKAGFGRNTGFGPALMTGFSYRMSTDAAGLPTRLRTDRQYPIRGLQEYSDTRYIGWGQTAWITAPPEKEVEDLEEVMDSTFDETFDETLQKVLEIAEDALASRPK